VVQTRRANGQPMQVVLHNVTVGGYRKTGSGPKAQ